jgi:hypothetical protein
MKHNPATMQLDIHNATHLNLVQFYHPILKPYLEQITCQCCIKSAPATVHAPILIKNSIILHTFCPLLIDGAAYGTPRSPTVRYDALTTLLSGMPY